MKDLISLSVLFKESIFRIPDYQRGYAWRQPQLDDFWDDIINLEKGRNHYTGMLSLKEVGKDIWSKWEEEKWFIEDKVYTPYHVVDGQQRLTTFIVMLSSILQLARKNHIDYLNGDFIDAIANQYIVEYKMPEKIVKAYLFGYEKDNPSFEYLRYRVLGEDSSGTLKETFYTSNLEFAKKYFDEKLKKIYEEKGKEEIELLLLKLTKKLQFNIHYIDDDFDVYVAFETMNNRGKKLSNLEILKNRLIYLTTIYKEEVLSKNEKEQLRRDINDAWSEVYFQLGRNKTNPLNDDEYLKNHWSLYFKYSRNKGDDYINFLLNKEFTPKAIYGEKVVLELTASEDDDEPLDQETIDQEDGVLHPSEIVNYVKSLKEVAQYWYYSYNPNESNSFNVDEMKWINRLDRIGVNYFRTLVVASLLNKLVTAKQRIRLCKTIERLIFICFRMAKYQSNYLSTFSYNFARDLYKGEIDIEEIISFFDGKIEENISDCVNAFMNHSSINFKNNDGFYSWGGLRYFLFEYETSIAEQTGIAKLDNWSYFTKSEKDLVSIEHIYPQKPDKWYWRNQFRNYQDDWEQKVLTNSLGNLLPLSQSINSSLQNDEFKLKKEPTKGRRGYSLGSYSEMEVAKKEDWTPECILERGLHLLTFLEERWNISFGDDETKKKILGLEFLDDGRTSIPEIVDTDYSTRDGEFTNEKGEIEVSEYLSEKDHYMVEFYLEIFSKLKEEIPDLYEKATRSYISLMSKRLNKMIAEVRIQNSKRKICVNTYKPQKDELQIGEDLPEGWGVTKNYKLLVKENESYEQLISALVHNFNNLLNEKQY